MKEKRQYARFPVQHIMRPTIPRLAVISLVATALAACSASTAPDFELRAARALWQQRQLASYDVTVSRSCECTAQMSGPVVVAVRSGEIVSRTYVMTGAAVEQRYASLFPSIDGLFATIDDARRRNAASVVVEYDRTLGFPTLIAIDYERMMADDEITVRATDLRVR